MAGELGGVGALAGVRVVVVGDGVWGQLPATYLGEYGADVLRIEHPAGDRLRTELLDGVDAWSVTARTGRSVTCDLGTESGRSLVRRLVATADVLLDGTGGRWSGRLVDPDPPRPVVVAVAALDDPGSPQGPGDGLLAAAAGGLLHLTGHPGRPPVRLGGDVVEHLTATFAAQAALAGLVAARRGEAVPPVRISGEACARRILEWTIVAHDVDGRIRHREGNQPAAVAPLGLYRSADEVLVAVVGASDANFRRLAAVMGTTDLLDDDRFRTARDRAERSAAINGIVADWAAGLDADVIVERCVAGGVLVGVVRTVLDLLADPHVVDRGEVVPWPTPGGTIAQPAPQPPSTLARPAPSPASDLGAGDEAVWTGLLGLAADELAQLRADGIIGAPVAP